MKKCLILVAMVLAAGCAEEPPPPELTEESVSEESQYSAAALEDEKEAKKKMGRIIVEEAVRGYRLMSDEKRYPVSLGELLEEGLLTTLPELPEGSRFSYNPETGEVLVVDETASTPTTPDTTSEIEGETSSEVTPPGAER